MYEVGPWFVALMDLAVLAFVALVVLIYIVIKRGRYQREAQDSIQAEIWQPTGWPKFYTVSCDINAQTVEIGAFTYHLNPKKRRWGLHPRIPFMGLSMLQVPIRKEYWYQDKEQPIGDPDETVATLTAAEIRALQREGRATMAARHAQELELHNQRVVDVISQSANKTYVYLGLGVIVLGIVILVARSFIIGG